MDKLVVDDDVKKKEEHDRRLLRKEIAMGVVAIIICVMLALLAIYANIDDKLRIAIISVDIIIAVSITLYAIRIEQIAGYYECPKCHYKYIPKYLSVLLAMHINRTRYMKCPQCGKRSWQKKVLRK